MSTDEVHLVDDAEVSEEDRAQINEQINQIIDETRIHDTDDIDLRPKKRGVALPVAINLLAAIVIAGAFYAASTLSERRELDMSIAARESQTPEGRLIAEIRRDAESRIEQKEAEISRIEGELAQLDAEREQLRNEMDEELARREAQFQAALAQQISLERNRLEALGRSEQDIADSIAELEASVRSEQNAELEEYRERAQAEIARKEAELERSQEMTQQILAAAQAERTRLEDESALREEELIARYEAEKAALSERTTEAELTLEHLAATRSQESLISDQIIGTYALLEDRLSAGDFAAAQEDLDRLESILLDPKLDNVPFISDRRETELFIINALGTLVELQASAERQGATESIIENAEQLAAARGLVSRGDALFADGETVQAAARYRDAIRLLPALSRASEQIETIEQADLDSQIARLLEDGASLLDSGSTEEAIARFAEAAALGSRGSLAKQAAASLDSVHRALAEQAADSYESRIASLETTRDRLRATEAYLEDSLESSERLIANLRQTVADRDRRVATLENQSRQLRADLAEAERESAELGISFAEATERVASLESVLTARDGEIADLKSRFETEAERANGLARDLEREKALTAELRSESDQLSTSIEALRRSLDTANRELSQAGSTVSRLESDLSTAKADVASLEAALAEARSKASSAAERSEELSSELEIARSTLRDTSEELEAARGEVDVVKRQAIESAQEFEARTSELETAIADATDQERVLQDQIASLLSRLSRANRTIESEATRIATLEESIDALRESIDTADLDQISESELEAATESGRRTALNEVLRYLDFVGSNGEAGIASRIAFDALSSKDLLYRRVFTEIDAALGSASETDLEQSGIVDSFDGREVVVSSDIELSGSIRGANMVVKRRQADGTERSIAKGVVTAISEESFRAEVRLYFDTELPALGDLVYLSR